MAAFNSRRFTGLGKRQQEIKGGYLLIILSYTSYEVTGIEKKKRVRPLQTANLY